MLSRGISGGYGRAWYPSGPKLSGSRSRPVKPVKRRSVSPLQPGNPDPMRFFVLRYTQQGEYTLAQIRYPDSNNYEGAKTLLLRASADKLMSTRVLDPHFLENDSNGLIARLKPTDDGWRLGLKLLNILAKNEP